MLTAAHRYTDEYARLVSALLLDILEDSRLGDLTLATSIGLDYKTIKTLDRLKPEQLHSLSKTYINYKKGLSIFDIDSVRMGNIIKAAATESEILETIDQYIIHGASNNILLQFFGYRSVQVATRKKILGIKTMKGRRKEVSSIEKKRIYDEYIETININDERIRYLIVSKQTNHTIHDVYMTITETIAVQKKLNTPAKMTA